MASVHRIEADGKQYAFRKATFRDAMAIEADAWRITGGEAPVRIENTAMMVATLERLGIVDQCPPGFLPIADRVHADQIDEITALWRVYNALNEEVRRFPDGSEASVSDAREAA